MMIRADVGVETTSTTRGADDGDAAVEAAKST